MTTREASCSCGRIRLRCRGEPLRISVCHCLECQRRTGSAFGAQARFLNENVEFLAGEPSIYERTADSGAKIAFRFCPNCGSTVWYRNEAEPDRIGVTLGAFADPSFPPPRFSVYEERMHPFVELKELSPIERSF
jgi:hypothetical protein